MQLPTRAQVMETFSDAEKARAAALTSGEKISYFTTSACLLALPFVSLPSLPAGSLAHRAVDGAFYVGLGLIVGESRLRAYAEKHKFFSGICDEASHAAPWLLVTSCAVASPHATTQLLAGLTAAGLVGGLVVGAPTNSAADQEAMFELRDWRPKPLDCAQSFRRGIIIGAWHGNVLRQSGAGIIALGVVARGLFDATKRRLVRNQANGNDSNTTHSECVPVVTRPADNPATPTPPTATV